MELDPATVAVLAVNLSPAELSKLCRSSKQIAAVCASDNFKESFILLKYPDVVIELIPGATFSDKITLLEELGAINLKVDPNRKLQEINNLIAMSSDPQLNSQINNAKAFLAVYSKLVHQAVETGSEIIVNTVVLNLDDIVPVNLISATRDELIREFVHAALKGYDGVARLLMDHAEIGSDPRDILLIRTELFFDASKLTAQQLTNASRYITFDYRYWMDFINKNRLDLLDIVRANMIETGTDPLTGDTLATTIELSRNNLGLQAYLRRHRVIE